MSTSSAKNRHAGLSGNDAQLLSKLCYLHKAANPKITAMRKGHLWVTKARADWCKITGLSLPQYERSVCRLRRLGKIVTEQHIRYQKSITFMRPIGQECGTQVQQDCGTQVQQNCGTLIEEHETEHGLSFAIACSPPSSVSSEDSFLEEPNPMVSVADFAEFADATKKPAWEKNKNLKADLSEVMTPGMLHAVWKQCMGNIGETVGSMTGDQAGRFKFLLKECPPGSAHAVVAYAVQNWNGFKSTLEAEYGQYKVSEKPLLGIMVTHVGPLLTWWKRRMKEEQAQNAVQAAKAVSAPSLPGKASNASQAKPGGDFVGNQKVDSGNGLVVGSHEWIFEFDKDDEGLEEAKAWSMTQYGCLPANYAEASLSCAKAKP